MKEHANQRRNTGMDRSSGTEGSTSSISQSHSVIATTSSEAISVRNIEETNKAFRRYSFDDNGGGYLGL